MPSPLQLKITVLSLILALGCAQPESPAPTATTPKATPTAPPTPVASTTPSPTPQALLPEPKPQLSQSAGSEEYAKRGRWYLDRLHYKEAIADLEKATKLDPKSAEHLAHLAYARYLNEDYKQATSLAKKAQALSKDCLRAENVLAMVAGKTANWKGKYKSIFDANDQLRASIKKQPKDIDPYLELSQYNASVGYNLKVKDGYQQATKLLNQAEKLDPLNPRIHAYRGRATDSLGKQDEAVEAYSKSLELYSESSAVHFDRGIAHYHASKYDKAIEDYKASLKLEPKNYQVINAMGVAYRVKGDLESSLESHKQALQLKPGSSMVREHLAITYREMGKHDSSLVHYSKLVKSHPRRYSYLNGRALVYLLNQNPGKAFEDYSTYIEKASYGSPRPYDYLLWRVASFRSGKTDKKIENYIKSRYGREKDGDWPLPVVKLYLGQITPDQLVKATSNKEQKCEAYFYIAEDYLKKKKRDKAVEYYKKCVETGVKDFSEYKLAQVELAR